MYRIKSFLENNPIQLTVGQVERLEEKFNRLKEFGESNSLLAGSYGIAAHEMECTLIVLGYRFEK